MPFLFQIYVEKIVRVENLCGENVANMRSAFLASSVVGLYSEGHRATLVTRYDSPEILNVHSLNIHSARVALL